MRLLNNYNINIIIQYYSLHAAAICLFAAKNNLYSQGYVSKIMICFCEHDAQVKLDEDIRDSLHIQKMSDVFLIFAKLHDGGLTASNWQPQFIHIAVKGLTLQ